MADNTRINGTTPASASSPLSPTWGPPKTPLAPDRLAKLANALGVSMPIPPRSKQPGPPLLSRSFSEFSGSNESHKRSPTPSAASSLVGFNSQIPTTSRFMLHVIPPMHLPHDSGSYDSDLTPPPPTASGYHIQFRRGTLIPVYSTLQAQLGAIAKEYALPSTAGLILYLVSSGSSAGPQSPTSPGSNYPTYDNERDEPGPRLSEDIWRHLWIRVLQAEQRENNMLLLPSLSRSPTPLSLSPSATRSTPFLNDSLQPPTPGYSPISPRPSYGSINSPSSSVFDLRSGSKSVPPSSESPAQSEPATPDTSVDVHETNSIIRANSLDLPGLNSPALIPILAKVEFDVDPHKAAWYKPWLRSRKVNHAKRAGSRPGRKGSPVRTVGTNESESEQDEDKVKEKVPTIPLLIGKTGKEDLDALLKQDPVEELKDNSDTAVTALDEAGYEQLSDSDSESDDDLEFAEESTARVSSIAHGKQDPLEDVFGTDADTWADMKAERRGTHEINPNVVNLALTGEELSMVDNSYVADDSHFTTREEEEVRELLDRMSQGGHTPDPTGAGDDDFPSPTLSKKHIPAPLVLVLKSTSDHIISTEPSPVPPSATAGTTLPYLSGDSESPEALSENDDEAYGYRAKSPTDSEKRAGTVFEDLDLGLDPSDDYDDDDPNDRRKSQYVMRAQLDEIERTLAQLSPRILKTDLEDEMNHSFSSATLSPNSPTKLTLSPLRSSDLSSAHTPRLPQHPDSPSQGASWPAVPFSQIKNASEHDSNRPPSPPRLAVNGVTTSAPRSFVPRNQTADVSSETNQRKKELEEEQSFYGHIRKNSTDSPVIPLSPDPFGRFSSTTPETPLNVAQPNQSQWDTVTVGRSSVTLGEDMPSPSTGRNRSGTTSRFSVDSLVEEQGPMAAVAAKSNRGTLMSVKSIKNLWRKSNKGDKEKDKDKNRPPTPTAQNHPSAPPSGRVSPAVSTKRGSGRISPGVPQRPERPSQENLDLPDVPPLPPSTTYGRYSPQPTMNRPSSRASHESSGRPSLDMSRTTSSHPGRSSIDHKIAPHQHRPSMDLMPPSSQRRSQDIMPPMNQQGLSVPYPSRSNASPIIPTQMLPGRQNGALDRLHFDQESPYPNPIRTVRYAPRTPSPPQLHHPQQMQPSQLASIPEQDQFARKSILKRNGGGSNQGYHQPQEQEPRSSFDGVPSVGPARKASSASSSSRSELASSPTTLDGFGRRPSMASSFTSIDSSQFEIVSPRLNSGMPYPSTSYHGSQDP